MTLALSLAIDPLSAMRPRPVAQTAGAGARPAPAAAAPAPAAPPRPAAPAARPTAPPATAMARRPPPSPAAPSEPWRVQVGLGVLGSAGMSLSPTVGLTGSVGARGRRWSLSIEGRVDLPRSASVSGGRVTASALGGVLVPCLHLGPLAGCALALAGAVRGSGERLADARQQTTVLAALGGRLAIEVPSNGGALAVRLHIDLVASVVRTTLRVGGEPAWTAPPLSGAVGAAALVRFW
jgi:hypothetical protein